jgi:hypothetical protein
MTGIFRSSELAAKCWPRRSAYLCNPLPRRPSLCTKGRSRVLDDDESEQDDDPRDDDMFVRFTALFPMVMSRG